MKIYQALPLILLMAVFSSCRSQEVQVVKQTEQPVVASPEVPAKVIYSPIAGSWYTNKPDALRRELRGYLDEGKGDTSWGGRVVGLVAPHAGYRFSGPVAGHAYAQLEGQAVKRVIVIAPSHHVPFSGFALPDAGLWETPLGQMQIDVATVKKLLEGPDFKLLDQAFAKEHAVDIQVPFLQLIAPDAQLVPIVAGRVDDAAIARAGQALGALLDDQTVIVASSDFTHYGANFGYMPFKLDDQTGENLAKFADIAGSAAAALDSEAFKKHLAETNDTICGAMPILVLMAALDKGTEGKVLKYDNSGRMTGGYEHAVSYVSIAFRASAQAGPMSEQDQKYLLSLARRTIQHHLAGKGRLSVDESEVPPAVAKKYGVFVTLNKNGNLRGCIGSILPVEALYTGVIRNAINAAANDTRFRPVTAQEEPELHIEISVLTNPKRIERWQDIVIGRDGVILTKGWAKSVFLPQVAPEQGWNLKQMLEHLSMKAGLPANGYLEGATFEIFQAQVFSE